MHPMSNFLPLCGIMARSVGLMSGLSGLWPGAERAEDLNHVRSFVGNAKVIDLVFGDDATLLAGLVLEALVTTRPWTRR